MPSRARRFIILSRSGSRENQKNQLREIFLLRTDDPFALQFSERTVFCSTFEILAYDFNSHCAVFTVVFVIPLALNLTLA